MTLGTQDLTVQLGRGRTATIAITEPAGVQADNLPLTTWGSSFILANRLHGLGSIPTPPSAHADLDPVRTRTDPRTIPVLELGAGTGLVGLTAATLWGTCVVLTDVAGIVPGLAANIAANAEGLAREGARVYGGTLDWSAPGTAIVNVPRRGGEEQAVVMDAGNCRAQIIVAADTVYCEDHPPLLTQTILAWLAPGNDARVVLVYPLRIAYLDHIRDLWERLEHAGLECIEEGKDEENNDDSWDEPAPYEWCIWKWKTDVSNSPDL